MSTERVSYNLVIYKNRDFKMNVYFKDADGDAVDLTGWSGKAQAKETMEPDSALIFEFDVTIADAAAGKVTVEVADAKTGVDNDDGAWDLLMTDPAGYDDSYIIGEISFVSVPTLKG